MFLPHGNSSPFPLRPCLTLRNPISSMELSNNEWKSWEILLDRWRLAVPSSRTPPCMVLGKGPTHAFWWQRPTRTTSTTNLELGSMQLSRGSPCYPGVKCWRLTRLIASLLPTIASHQSKSSNRLVFVPKAILCALFPCVANAPSNHM